MLMLGYDIKIEYCLDSVRYGKKVQRFVTAVTDLKEFQHF